jgi:SAM-dependent methyltransferase
VAKIEIIHPENKDCPESIETIEVRLWGFGGTKEQAFYIGSGLNYQANSNIWVEIIYDVEGAPILYTRNFLHQNFYDEDVTSILESRLEELIRNGEGQFGFGDMLPETKLSLIVEKSTFQDENNVEKQYSYCHLVLSVDTGAVFGRTSPGERSVEIKINLIELDEGARFMHDLISEIGAVLQGRHPDPANFPCASSEWPFIWQLNRLAYNKVSESYHEEYFENPLLVEAFDSWLKQLPSGGSILDAGCGHGQPVIAYLLERGFQVIGSDFSPEMLRRAIQQFPQATFINVATSAITYLAAFDGVCSFSSMLYMDPIDLLQSIYRLYCALKPGGMLFLYGFDVGPDWRGEPFHHVLGQWMWSWHYGMEEAAHLLEEHGYFEVLVNRKVVVDENEGQRIAFELEKQKKEEEEYRQKQANNPEAFPSHFINTSISTSIERSPYAYVIIARRCQR